MEGLILVAPYWNLNVLPPDDGLDDGLILVAPYWNLNKASGSEISKEQKILVAPYWNLNLKLIILIFYYITNISSSILEFKY